MAITYDAPSNTITVTGNTSDLLQDIYNTDVANGWNVFHKQGNRQFYSEARIIIGDGSTSTACSDKRAHLDFASTAIGSGQIGIEVKTNAALTLGELVDAGDKVVRYGVDIMYPVMGTGTNRYLIYGQSGSQINLYGCSFRGFTSSYYSLWIGGIITAWHCIFDRVELHGVSQSDIYDAVFLEARYYVLTGITASTMDEIKLFTSRCFMVDHSSGLTASNVVAKGITYLYYALYQTGNSYLINVDSDAWAFAWSNSPNAKVYHQYEFNRKILDKDGNAYNGKAWTLKDKDGNTVESGTTQADGKLSATDLTVTHGYYNQANGNTEQLSSPFTLEVEEDADNGALTLLNLPIDTKDVIGVETMPELAVAGGGGGIPYTRIIEKPTELEDASLAACTALLIQNKQLKKRRILEALT